MTDEYIEHCGRIWDRNRRFLLREGWTFSKFLLYPKRALRDVRNTRNIPNLLKKQAD